jgi:4'-phosphopantetheinyl transferase
MGGSAGMPLVDAASPAALSLDLETGATDLWVIPLPAAPADVMSSSGFCSAAERACAARMPERKRARVLFGRSAVRDILSRYLPAQRPGDLTFACGPFGKPRLLDGAIAFSVTHSGTMALCAVGGGELGVDVERIRYIAGPLAIARTWFSRDEAAAIRSHPASGRRRVFFHLWTKKEACAKAMGLGLQLPFASFTVRADGDESAVQTLSAGGRRLWLRSISLGRPWAAALAGLGDPSARLRCFRYAG